MVLRVKIVKNFWYYAYTCASVVINLKAYNIDENKISIGRPVYRNYAYRSHTSAGYLKFFIETLGHKI